MVQLPRRRRLQAEPAENGKASGSDFLRESRRRLAAVIGQYAVEEAYAAYDSFGDLFSALEEEVWREAEQLLKESYRNGSRRRRR